MLVYTAHSATFFWFYLEHRLTDTCDPVDDRHTVGHDDTSYNEQGNAVICNTHRHIICLW